MRRLPAAAAALSPFNPFSRSPVALGAPIQTLTDIKIASGVHGRFPALGDVANPREPDLRGKILRGVNRTQNSSALGAGGGA